jgi:6,7-dimethyl-8-ribityllumazine synthase
MSCEGAPAAAAVPATGVRVAIVAASWHEQVMNGLLAGALRGCAAYAVDHPRVVRVPGSFELGVAAARLARSGLVDAVVALGVVIRGGTPHFDYVCAAATQGLTTVSVDHALPVGFGLLTCDDLAQALDRAGLPGSHEDKGYEAAAAAIETVPALRHLPATVPPAPLPPAPLPPDSPGSPGHPPAQGLGWPPLTG